MNRSTFLTGLTAAVTTLWFTTAALAGDDKARLTEVLDAQAAEVQARYQYRHPAETMAFFGITPGMTVVEGLPGYGWYSKILIPYLGPDGRLIGANYAASMWPLFGFFDEQTVEAMKTWETTWPKEASGWAPDGAAVAAFQFGSMPDEMKGTADAVLLVRALHNLARFEGEGGYLTAALGDVYEVLKPGGIVGVVQHEARPEMSDAFASGDHGYLKRDWLIGRMQDAGFEFVVASEINQNPKDQPGEEDVVWRLPPSFNGTGDDAEKRAAVEAIGESNRMTLKFRKPE